MKKLLGTLVALSYVGTVIAAGLTGSIAKSTTYTKNPDGTVSKEEVIDPTEVDDRIIAIQNTIAQLNQRKAEYDALIDAEIAPLQKELNDLTQVQKAP